MSDEVSDTAQPFRVDLRGIVDVLARHLYSSPAVFVRELIQNSVDAISARRQLDADHQGSIEFEVDLASRTITVIDSGVGLTRAQIDEFLACVGATSKMDELDEAERRSFIGQFGIGILSTFMVADDVVILTQSVDPSSPSLEWRGSSSGTYVVRELENRLEAGTRVILKIRDDSQEFAEPARLWGLVALYGGCQDTPIQVTVTGRDESPRSDDDDHYYYDEYDYGPPRKPRLWSLEESEHASYAMGFAPLDQFAIESPEIGLEAVAYVLPEAAPRSAAGLHTLYLQKIFVCNENVRLVPPWASFLRLVINSTQLNATASRESVREDEIFEKTKEAISAAIRAYLHRLGRSGDDRLERFLSIHDSALRTVALEDDEFFRAIIDLLPFETSLGTVRFGRFRAENTIVRIAPTLDLFRSCAAIAAAQGVTVFNGGYTSHAELLEHAVSLDSELTMEAVSARDLIMGMNRATAEESEPLARIVEVGREALRGLDCSVTVGAFDPEDVPAVYAEGAEQSLARSIGAAKAAPPDEVWDEILDALEGEIDPEARGAFLCLNARCSLFQSLQSITDRELLAAIVRVIYVQSLLLGRQPLTTEETSVFNDSLRLVLDKHLEEQS